MMPKTHQPRANRLMKANKQPGVSDRDRQKEVHRAPTGQDFDPKLYQYPGLTEKDVLDLKEVFDSFDLNGDGFIAPLELRAALLKFGYPAKKETIYHIVSEYDQEYIGELSFADFLRIATNTANEDTREDVRVVFKKYDKHGRGYFTIDDLRQVAKDLGENVDEETLEEIVSRVDTNMDGKVSFEDFYNVMTQRIFM